MAQSIASNFSGKIFFYCVPPISPANAAYQHLTVCLGEGLKRLGIDFYSNINYWKISDQSEEYLFRNIPDITYKDCDIIVFNQEWFEHGNSFPHEIFHSKRNHIAVYMDSSDGSYTISLKPDFRQFDYIFRTHCCKHHTYPSNFVPWAFGLSDRILQETSFIPEFQQRQRKILVNFRTNGIQHSLRSNITQDFLPQINTLLPIDDYRNCMDDYPLDSYGFMQWTQTGRRHHPNYFEHLKEVMACACFGGFFVSPWVQDQSLLFSRILKRLIGQFNVKTKRIIQWDSWRFWESIAAGCATFHVDFDQYGFILPVMPKNWTHYIGVDIFNVSDTVERLVDEPEILERTSVSGRSWALENYSPMATALRFLETVSGAT